MNLRELFNLHEGKNFIKIKVVPNSPKTEYVGIFDDGTHKFRIKGITEDGKANKELIIFLCKNLELKKDNISIISGATSRSKLIRIDF